MDGQRVFLDAQKERVPAHGDALNAEEIYEGKDSDTSMEVVCQGGFDSVQNRSNFSDAIAVMTELAAGSREVELRVEARFEEVWQRACGYTKAVIYKGQNHMDGSGTRKGTQVWKPSCGMYRSAGKSRVGSRILDGISP